MYRRRTFDKSDEMLSQNVRSQLEAAEDFIMRLRPSRNRELALTHLEDAMLRTNLAIADDNELREEET